MPQLGYIHAAECDVHFDTLHRSLCRWRGSWKETGRASRPTTSCGCARSLIAPRMSASPSASTMAATVPPTPMVTCLLATPARTLCRCGLLFHFLCFRSLHFEGHSKILHCESTFGNFYLGYKICPGVYTDFAPQPEVPRCERVQLINLSSCASLPRWT